MPKDNEWEEILEVEGFNKAATERSIDSCAFEVFDALSNALPPLDPDLPELDEKIIEAERQHQRELDCIITKDKIAADDPCFEQRASHRRSAVYAHDKLKTAIGAEPDDGDVIPPPSDAEYAPAPKIATGFVVQTTKRRRPKRAVPPTQTSTDTLADLDKEFTRDANGGSRRTNATIWDGIKL
jgi:hypothetical protein